MGDVVDKISIPVDTTAAQAAVGFDKLAESMQKTATLQAALNQAQSQSGDLTRLSAYRQEAELLNQTTERNVQAFQRLAQAANDNGRAFGASTRVIQEAGTTIGRLGAEISGMGAWRGVIDTVTRSLALLSTSLFTGGELVAGGGVIAGVAGLAYVFTSAAREADELAAKTLANARALGTYSDQIKKLRTDASGRISSADADRANTSKLDSGLGSVADYNVAIAALKDLVKNNDPKVLENSIRTAYAAADRETLVKLEEIKNALLTAPERLSQYEAFRSSAKSDDADKKQNAAALRSIGDEAYLGNTPTDAKAVPVRVVGGKMPWQTADDQMNKINASDRATGNKLIAGVGSINKNLDADSVGVQNALQQNAMKQGEWQRQDDEQTARAKAQLDQQEFERQQKSFQLQKQERQIVNQAIQQTAGIVAGGTAKMLTAVAEGQKVSGAAILKSIGESMIAEGTMAVFSGIIDLASLNPAGAVKIATGAAEIAAGVGFAGVGAAATPPTPSTPSSASQAGSSPINNNSSSGNSGGTTIVYVEMPSIVSPSADDGLRIRDALEQANRTYGTQV